MREAAQRSLFGVVLLVLWLPTLSNLSPFPPQRLDALRVSYEVQAAKRGQYSGSSNSKTDMDRQVGFMSTKVWLEWIVLFLFSLIGIASSVTAVLRTRYWSFLVLATSVLFLIGFILQYESLHQPILESWMGNAQAVFYAGGLVTIGSFVWGSLIQPISFLAITLYLLYYKPT